jgi:hypothetical protein
LNDVTVDGSLNVFDLDVSGNARFNNNVTVDGSLNVFDLDVSGNAIFNKNVTVDGSLNVVNLAEFNSLKVNTLAECYDLNVLGSTQLDHARIINGVTVDGSLNAVDLAVSGNAIFNNNLVVSDNFIAKNITFPDNTIQTTAYIPNNIIQNEIKLPYFFGTINFDNNVDLINSPSITFNNVNTWNTNDIVIKFSIFEISDNTKIYDGYLCIYPSSININETITNNLTIPCDNSPYFNIISTNGMNSSENISIILNRSSNISRLYFRFIKSTILECYYHVNCSIISGSPSSVNNITIGNIDLDNFSSNF